MNLSLKRTSLVVSLVMLIFMVSGVQAHAKCTGGLFINPVTDIYWPAMFPIKIGGIPLVPNADGLPEMPDLSSAPICICPLPPPFFFRIGIPISYNDPSNFIEAVKDPFCFPSLGFQLPLPPSLTGYFQGTAKGQTIEANPSSTFFQAHYAYFAPLLILDVVTDYICLETKSATFDILYLTEIDPLWRSDFLSLVIHPESILFANIAAQLVCTVDSVGAQFGYPIDPLFWCAGSWSTQYPMTGNSHMSKVEEASALTTSRLLYKLGREFLLYDWASYLCSPVPMPILRKSQFKLQIARPVVGMQSIPIGRSSMIWGTAKNPPSGMCDNFLYMLFQRRECCVL